MKSRTLLAVVSMFFLVGINACTTTDNAQAGSPVAQVEQTQNSMTDAPPAQNPERQQKMMDMCPMQVEGTTREVVKLEDGVGMDFTTSGDVEELRRRVEKMAQMHEKMHGGDGMMHGQMDDMEGQMKHGEMHEQATAEQRQMHQEMKEMMSGVTVSTEPIDRGMRMKFSPQDPGQVDKLYEMMERHSQKMGEHGQCPMMQMMEGGSMGHSHE